MNPKKYSDDDLRRITPTCSTLREVCEKLGAKTTGGSVGMISRRLNELGISRQHFIHNGPKYSPTKKSPKDILHKRDSGNRTKTGQLKRALLEIGVPYRCSIDGCPLTDSWNGKPLTLQIDHINGHPLDDRQENLRFICPNCHSQTDNWKSKNRG